MLQFNFLSQRKNQRGGTTHLTYTPNGTFLVPVSMSLLTSKFSPMSVVGMAHAVSTTCSPRRTSSWASGKLGMISYPRTGEGVALLEDDHGGEGSMFLRISAYILGHSCSYRYLS
ncbi:hypothetical protein K438DRAFT_2156070 [Mycena galopus ATCC 62051]|nr:hypothetical protein K438DRAFT_2156070 [Mycena galopus ATCC 62051]